MLRESNPQITTVDQHMEMRGKVMADIVIKKIQGIDSPRTVMLPTELVVRQSARPPQARGLTPAPSRCGTTGLRVGGEHGAHRTAIIC